MQIITSIEQFNDLKNISAEKVVGRFVHEERLRGYKDKEEKKYLLLTHEEWLARRKIKMQMTFLFQVRADVKTITKKTEVVDVAANMVTEEVVTIFHKP